MPKRRLTKTDTDTAEAAKRRRLSAPEHTSKNGLESENTRDEFVYEPLDHGTDSIRVFELHPGPKDSMIQCTMRNAKISDEAHICLSYTWQPSNPQHIIEVNGCSHSVGENLYQFLRAYRTYMTRRNAADRGSPLWVDALCINQPDIKERNHQVQQMGDIYRNAAKVLVWLGVLDDQVRNFLRSIRVDTKETHQCIKRNNSSSGMAPWQVLEEEPDGVDFSEKLRLQRHARALVTAEYWTRIWVAQELLLPGEGKVFLFDGWASYELGELHAPLKAIRSASEDSGVDIIPCIEYLWRRCVMITYSEWEFDPTNCSDFSSLLFYLGYCGCQDSRDRVFALVPLCTAQGHFDIDYSNDRFALFRYVLEQAEDACIDGLLILGAQLIEALELREPTTEHSVLRNIGSLQEFGTEFSMANRQSSDSISVSHLVWATSDLTIIEAANCAGENQPLHRKEAVVCIYAKVIDGPNVHVFEYAMKACDTSVSVRYARSYEFLRGPPEMNVPEDHFRENCRYLWLDRPSEDVYYYSGPFDMRIDDKEKNKSEPALHEWKSALVHFQESELHNQFRTKLNCSKARLLPAHRVWTTFELAGTYARREYPLQFAATTEHIDSVLAYSKDHDGHGPPTTISRPCTLLLELPKDA